MPLKNTLLLRAKGPYRLMIPEAIRLLDYSDENVDLRSLFTFCIDPRWPVTILVFCSTLGTCQAQNMCRGLPAPYCKISQIHTKN